MDRSARQRMPRDSAGNLRLEGGTGPITGMCNCGDFLEVYKNDVTFRVKSPEAIDPGRTNPTAPWVASVVDTVGSAHPAVARVLLQGRDLLQGAAFAGNVEKQAIISLLHTIKEELVACSKVASRVSRDVADIFSAMKENGIPTDGRVRVLNPFPQVANLETDATAFLIHAKRGIQLICRLPSLFLSVKDTDTNFDFLGKTLANVIGTDDDLTKFVEECAPSVRHIIELRNFQEHPKEKRTVVANVSVAPDGSIVAPVWFVNGEPPIPLAQDMTQALTFLIEVAENMVGLLVWRTLDARYPFVIERIPADELNPNCPIGLRLSLDPTKLKVPPPSAKPGE